ncbi:MAG: acyltransferase [Legionella sp.]|nr:MAG: acyltransferase [Legionella sp.]
MPNLNNALKVICVGLSLLMMSACSYYHHERQVVAQKKTCYANCVKKCKHCLDVCDQNTTVCQAKADAMAAVHFSQYRHQQNVQGELTMAELKSFRDPLACLKTTCDCVQDKRVCQQSCDGKVYKRMQSAMRSH